MLITMNNKIINTVKNNIKNIAFNARFIFFISKKEKINSLMLFFCVIMLALISINSAECMAPGEDREPNSTIREKLAADDTTSIENVLTLLRNIQLSAEQLSRIDEALNNIADENPNNIYGLHQGHLHNAGNTPYRAPWAWQDIAFYAATTAVVVGVIYIIYHYWTDVAPIAADNMINPTQRIIVRRIAALPTSPRTLRVIQVIYNIITEPVEE